MWLRRRTSHTSRSRRATSPSPGQRPRPPNHRRLHLRSMGSARGAAPDQDPDSGRTRGCDLPRRQLPAIARTMCCSSTARCPSGRAPRCLASPRQRPRACSDPCLNEPRPGGSRGAGPEVPGGPQIETLRLSTPEPEPRPSRVDPRRSCRRARTSALERRTSVGAALHVARCRARVSQHPRGRRARPPSGFAPSRWGRAPRSAPQRPSAGVLPA